ncbi:MAG: hypothetical protein M9913_08315 [Bryobacteraceae bacterium]|nr:hypothetical protein [Bryobacteraceae bacterium]
MSNVIRKGIDALLLNGCKGANIESWKKEFTGDIIAVTLDPVLAILRANSGMTQPKVREFMQCSERPCCLRVLIIEHDQGRDAIGECEAPEYFQRDVGVMAAEVSEEEDKDAAGLNGLTQVTERLISEPGGAVRGQAEIKLVSHSSGERRGGEVGSDRVDEFNWFGVIVFEHRPDETLARLDVPDEGIQFRIESLAHGQGPEVLPAIPDLGWFSEVEDQKGPTVDFGHLQEDAAGRLVLAAFHGLKALCSTPAAGIGETEGKCRIFE